MKKEDIRLPKKFDYQPEEKHDPALIDKIKKTIGECSEDLKDVSMEMKDIRAQGGWRSFWRAGDNVGNIAEHVGKMTQVQEKSLDLIVMLMGASNRLKEDYDTIIESIEDLSSSNSSSPEVLDYLVKVKQTVKEMKNRDDLLDSLITYSNDLRDSMEQVNEVAIDVNKEVLETKEKFLGFSEEMEAEVARLQQQNQSMSDELQAQGMRLTSLEETEAAHAEALQSKVDALTEQQAEFIRFKKIIGKRSMIAISFLAVLSVMVLVFMVNNWS